MRTDERGVASLTVVLCLPLLVTLLAGVLQLGALRVAAARVASAADLATVAAVDDQDESALVQGRPWRLAADAESVAREYFARNLAALAPVLAVTPGDAAARAEVAVFAASAMDPLTGWSYDGPAVRIAAAVPIRTPAFGALLLPTVTVVNVRAASTAR